MIPAKKEFSIAPKIRPLILVTGILFLITLPFAVIGASGGDTEGGIALALGGGCLLLFFRLMKQLRFWWLARRLQLRIYAEWLEENKLGLTLTVDPTQKTTLSLLAFELLEVTEDFSLQGPGTLINYSPCQVK